MVLFAPGRLHHGAAGDGRGQRADCQFLAQEHFRLLVCGILEPGDRGVRLSRVGPSSLRCQPIGLCRHDLFVPEFRGRDSLGDQGLQLERDALQELNLL